MPLPLRASTRNAECCPWAWRRGGDACERTGKLDACSSLGNASGLPEMVGLDFLEAVLS